MKAKTKALRRNYDKLTAMERFKLALAALERDDKSELKALRESAPRYTYQMIEWEYRQAFVTLQTMVNAALLEILLAAVPMALAFGSWYCEKGYTEDDPDHWQIMRGMATAVVATWDGLRLFCDGLGITLEQAATVFPMTEIVGPMLRFARGVLEVEDNFDFWLATEYLPNGGELPANGDELKAKRAELIARQRQENAEGTAAALRELWDQELNR